MFLIDRKIFGMDRDFGGKRDHKTSVYHSELMVVDLSRLLPILHGCAHLLPSSQPGTCSSDGKEVHRRTVDAGLRSLFKTLQ